MWTPKRILILVSSTLLFLSGYGVYAFVFGDIDGLQPLGAEFYPPDGRGPIEPGTQESQKQAMIRQAFGPDCEELRRDIRLLVRDKGMVLSAGEFEIVKQDGRVKFAPFTRGVVSEEQGRGLPRDQHGPVRLRVPDPGQASADAGGAGQSQGHGGRAARRRPPRRHDHQQPPNQGEERRPGSSHQHEPAVLRGCAI